MNRIRELRDAAGLTQQDLAGRVGTSSVQIGRLEKGERRLTLEWLHKISQALECSPAELISNRVLVDPTDEVIPATLSLAGVAAAIASKGLMVYEVVSGSVVETGLMPGSTITVDESKEAVAGIRTGDIVLVEIHDPSALALRVYVHPCLLVTHRPGSINTAIRTDDRSLRITVKGVVVRG
jgi:transcriptional regulator with XRE-family HTH domain